MKKNVLFIVCVFFGSSLFAEVSFSEHFHNNALRLDIVLSGDASSQDCSIKQVLSEDFWGGRVSNTNVFHGKGDFKFNVYNNKSNTLIYTDGFCTLFQEWQTTGEALEMKRSFENTIRMPMPKTPVLIELIKRVNGVFIDTLMQLVIDPESQLVRPAEKPDAIVKTVIENGKTEACIDIVLIGEGYTEMEAQKFFEDAGFFANALFTSAPFKANEHKFNIRAVLAASDEQGVDDPNSGIYKKTALGASYNTLYSDRYLMTTEMGKVSNYAGLVPYDQIIILVNTEKYGGGGIFNFYALNSTRGRKNIEVFIHEFGHSFAGLADEYYTSDVSYENYFPLHLEPWEANITTRVDFESKWAGLIDADTPVPTPATNKYKNKIGLFEGGGYVPKGVYRPFVDCRMKSNEAKDFCPVCSLEIVKTIKFYTLD